MEEIFKQYGAPIIIGIIVVALIAIFGTILSGDGYVAAQFKTLISTFMSKANLGAPSLIVPGLF